MEKNKPHILIVDDDDRIRELVKQYLNDNNFIVSTADNAEKAKKQIDQFSFDLAVFDIMMPGQDGFELTKEIKKKLNLPIILLTARGESENRIKGLELGADDYLGKPFEPKELLLRIKNILSKSTKLDIKKLNIIGKAKVNLNKMSIELNNKISKINNVEKKVLLEMLSSPGKTFTRSQIGSISGISQERSIDVMITRLRQKIELDPKKPKYLQTIRGSGYVLWIE
ncbi:MAG: DNA-binding response regulator [Pelagibacteraceae bacterium TMED287]|nr:MAG: DNA-binding response regulator [Pelagibacteraceae bacterium TMED287]